MDVLDIIEVDNKALHERFKKLVYDTSIQPKGQTAADELESFRRDFVATEDAKKRSLYKDLNQFPELRESVARILEEGETIFSLLKEIDFRNPSDRDWPEYVSSIKTSLDSKYGQEQILLEKIPEFLDEKTRSSRITDYERLRLSST